MKSRRREGAGRPPSVTADEIERMKELFRGGATVSQVAHATGLSRSTVKERFDKVAIGNLYIEGIQQKKQMRKSATVRPHQTSSEA